MPNVSSNIDQLSQQPEIRYSLADEPAIGAVVLMERGTQTYLGGNEWSYSTVLGEYNTFNGSQYVKYLYDDMTHNATFAGHSLTLYDWYAVFSNSSQVLVDDMRWIVQYWQTQGGGRWAELDLWDHSFLPAIEGPDSLKFGQHYTDGFSSLDVWYTVKNYDKMKITLNFTTDTTRLYRFKWMFTGVDGNAKLTEGEKGLAFDDVNIGWDDAELNASYEWTVETKKLDITFDNVTIEAGIPYELDPSVSPVMGADSDDDWWSYGWPTNDVWTHQTNSLQHPIHNNTHPVQPDYFYHSQCRFPLAIAQGSTITGANLSGYETWDGGSTTTQVRRINETNVGSLEGDTTRPIFANATVDTESWDGSASHWKTVNVTALVQEQINLGAWSSGYYIGFVRMVNQDSAAQWKWADYQDAATNHAYMNVTYTTGGAAYTEYVYETIQLSDSTSVSAGFSTVVTELIGFYDSVVVAMDAVLTVFEQINLSENVAVGANFAITILEVLGLAASVVATKGVGGIDYSVTIYEAIGASESVTTSMSASVSILETIGFIDMSLVYRGQSITVFENIVISSSTATSQLTHYYVYENIGFVSSIGIEGGIEVDPVRSMIYELFLSLEVWGYLGPALLVIVGYILTKKDLILGVLWFVLECLIVAQYLLLVEATPNYWWHVYIIMIGGLIPFGFAMVGRRR